MFPWTIVTVGRVTADARSSPSGDVNLQRLVVVVVVMVVTRVVGANQAAVAAGVVGERKVNDAEDSIAY